MFPFHFFVIVVVVGHNLVAQRLRRGSQGEGGGAAGERASPSANEVVTIIIGFVRRPVPHPSAPAPPAPSLFGGR